MLDVEKKGIALKVIANLRLLWEERSSELKDDENEVQEFCNFVFYGSGWIWGGVESLPWLIFKLRKSFRKTSGL